MSEERFEQSPEDQYLDLLIRLAFEQKERQEIARLVSETEPSCSREEREASDNAFLLAMEKADAERKLLSKRRKQMKIKKAIAFSGKIAACLLLIALIAFPVAMAVSSAFRSQVMRLLVELDMQNGEAHISLTENADEAFMVPADWPGEWHPAYIPEDMELSSIDAYMFTVCYSDGGDKLMWFSEKDESFNSLIGTEQSEISSITVNGMQGWAFEGNDEYHSCTIVWSTDDRWF